MTPRLEAARAAMAHAIAIYTPTHIYNEACAKLTDAAAELEAAARVEDDKPSDPPVTDVPPVFAELQPVPPIPAHVGEPAPVLPIPGASSEPVIAPLTLTDTHNVTEPAPPSAAEAVADALAPYEAPPVPEGGKPAKSRNKTK